MCFDRNRTIAHNLGRASTGAAFVTFVGMDDNLDSPPLPGELDVSHFPNFDIRNPKCQNYIIEMIEAMHGVGSLVSGPLFYANKKYHYTNLSQTPEFVLCR